MKDNEDSFLCVQDTCPGKEKRDVDVKSSWASISDSVDDVKCYAGPSETLATKILDHWQLKSWLISVISLLILK